jgi:hypothetical protein
MAMMKRKFDKISGHDPWEIEAAGLVEYFKLDPADARDVVAIRWMQRGDDRPLAAALRDGPLGPPVLSQLLKMVDEGQFTAKRKRGAPRQPSKVTRDIFIAARYELRTGKSDDAIQALAKEFNIGDEAIRRAIKHRPKPTT